MTTKPSLVNYQIPVVCPNCQTDVLVGLKKASFYFMAIALLSFVVAGLIMVVLGEGTDREFGLMLLAYGIFMSLIFIMICHTRIKKSKCIRCGGIVKAEYKKGAASEFEWVTTFIPTAASEAFSSMEDRKTEALESNGAETIFVKALKILSGILLIVLGKSLPILMDVKGDLPVLLGYGLIAIGLFMIFDGGSSFFKKSST